MAIKGIRGPESISILTEDEKKLLTQNVVVGRLNEPASQLRVPRSRLTKRAVDDLFETDAEFLRDNTGQLIHFDDWIIECQVPPAVYAIINLPHE